MPDFSLSERTSSGTRPSTEIREEPKNKLGETKAWATTPTAKSMQAVFFCMKGEAIHAYSFMNSLSDIQQKVLDFIFLRWESGEALPSCREIAGRFGWASPKAATDALEVLKRKGFLVSDPSSTRKYRLGQQALGLPVLGEIPAGFPVDSEKTREDRLTLNPSTFGIHDRASAFYLRVRGDSMTGRQIFDGDLVLVEKCEEPKHNDVVAALIDSESTLKAFVREAGQCWLKSENPNIPICFQRITCKSKASPAE